MFGGKPPDPNAIRPSWVEQQLILLAYGPEAYRRTRPGNPLADLGQTIGELPEGLPKVPFRSLVRWPKIRSLAGVPFSRWGRALYNRLREFVRIEHRLGTREFLRQVTKFKPGGEYLNVVFGWQPLVRDLVSAYELSQRLESELSRLIRENGKGVHRRTTLEKKKTTEDLSVGPSSFGPWPPYTFVRGGEYGIYGYGVDGSSTHRCVRTVEERVWFSGKYRYFIPDVKSPVWRARAVAALYGALPTPSLLWELMPLSWLLDWFVNFGDVIANVSTNAVDNLVLEYGFLMRHRTEHIEASAHVAHTAGELPGYQQWPAIDHTFRSVYQAESKARAGCDPFFPGAQPWVFHTDSPALELPFTNRQWAVLASLGLSRGFNR
jgi:hypothetical protein